MHQSIGLTLADQASLEDLQARFDHAQDYLQHSQSFVVIALPDAIILLGLLLCDGLSWEKGKVYHANALGECKFKHHSRSFSHHGPWIAQKV